jgi:hypothetical protein
MACGALAAAEVPMPRPRPAEPHRPAGPRSFAEAVAGLDLDVAAISGKATACDERLRHIAVFEAVPRLIGPGGCGGADLVVLDSVLLPAGGRVAVEPAPPKRFAMAEWRARLVGDVEYARVAEE